VECGYLPTVRAAVASRAPRDRLRRRTLLGQRSCSWVVLPSLRHDASTRRSVLTRSGGLEWGSAGGQVAAVVGAEVVAAGESFSADETVSATRGPTSGSLALIACPRPLSGDVGEGLVAAAVTSALGPSLLLQRSPASHPELVVPQALRCGGCSYPREWNRSSVCNGILSAGDCSLWLSGPEHLGILGAIPCFLISSTRTRLSAS
jgi:hypothetical protein